ncbi:MAG TPA: ABC transporter ATP-binding protein [Vicinamibacterales bacterium]|nr:ABC transporter ATP-binding protein [Vicinamibacterales bacterium]
MPDVAISAQGLSKRYTIDAGRRRHDTLRDEMVFGVKSLFGGNREARRERDRESTLWAVKDVSFDVAVGEAVGIIGGNGAGKSTLLKILSRVTDPTAGRCEVFGHMTALLEVGTGFHGELTGRENVYLNGAILGMKKAEIDRNFDQIVAFAEVEKFIDTPVKRYSTGMQVRLAFAVAAHLEPEILIVDEVLAVGDLKFQNKCIGRMGEVARQGRTVLFVSHNMGAVTNLCTTGLWLDHGRVRMRGAVREVADAYVKGQSGGAHGSPLRRRAAGGGAVQIVSARSLDSNGAPCVAFMMGQSVVFEFEVEFAQPERGVNVTIDIRRKEMGMHVLSLQSDDVGYSIDQETAGTRRIRVELPNCMLYPTSYDVRISLWVPGRTLDYADGLCEFAMIQSDVTRRTSSLVQHREAIYFAPSVWEDAADS